MNEQQALTTIVTGFSIDLAVAGWLDTHQASAKDNTCPIG